MKVAEIVRITAGALLAGDGEVNVEPERISTDSRNIAKRDFFLALKGAAFDGNDFAAQALAKGAQGVIVERCTARLKDEARGKIIISVKDSVKALGLIAASHRRRFEIPVIAVTGSNGKTTVKEMAAQVLAKRYNVLKNEGTKNNHIGVPQTLLKLKPSYEACVLEMGMNHRGEIALLADIARPTTAVITNIGPSHLEFLGNLKNVLKAKMEILETLDKGRKVVLNGDDRFLRRIKSGRFEITRFGFAKGNDFRATHLNIKGGRIQFTVNGNTQFALGLLGTHNVYNALAAIAVSSQLGISHGEMRKALLEYEPADMRLVLRNVKGVTVINDCYNSNPMSMERALQALKSYPAKRRWLVSGDMLELGRMEKRFHRTVGEMAARSRVGGLVALGLLSQETIAGAKRCGMAKDKLWHCSTHDEAAHILARSVSRGDAVLVKGSRLMMMEKVIAKFIAGLESKR